jgi:hypothetical protein
MDQIWLTKSVFEERSLSMIVSIHQGDQTGRIFAQWAIVLGQVFENYRISPDMCCFFPKYRLRISLDSNGLDYVHFGHFSKNSSGHRARHSRGTDSISSPAAIFIGALRHDVIKLIYLSQVNTVHNVCMIYVKEHIYISQFYTFVWTNKAY